MRLIKILILLLILPNIGEVGSFIYYKPGHPLTEQEREEITLFICSFTTKKIANMYRRVIEHDYVNGCEGREEVVVDFEPQYMEEDGELYRYDYRMIVYNLNKLGIKSECQNLYFKKAYEFEPWFCLSDPIELFRKLWHFQIEDKKVDMEPINNMSYLDLKNILERIHHSDFKKVEKYTIEENVSSQGISGVIGYEEPSKYMEQFYKAEFRCDSAECILKIYATTERNEYSASGPYFEFSYNKVSKSLTLLNTGFWMVV